MPTRTVAALELPHRFGDPVGQLELTDTLLLQARGAQLALLPECALTGYLSEGRDYDLSAFAEPLDGPTCGSLSKLARKHSLALAGPLIEASGEALFNAFVVFDATGALVAHYRKRNPWMPETWATAGELPNPVFEIAGMRITIAICFDVHFLGEDAPQQLAEADVLLFPSAWVDEDPVDARSTLLPELARTFGVGIVNANWGVGTPVIQGQGGSRIVSGAGLQRRSKGGVVLGELEVG
jgi:predicted amidohydrolase